MDLKALKTTLRREVIRRILALDADERQAQESALAERFTELPGVVEASTILLYVSAFAEEFATRPLLDQVLKLGKTLILPRVDRSSKTLHLYQVTNLTHDLEPGHRGIAEPSLNCPKVEPETIDWVLVPGLAFSTKGYRLGRGAGHYDKLLPTLRPEASRWALILEPQWLENLPIEPHDQPVDGVADWRRSVRTN